MTDPTVAPADPADPTPFDAAAQNLADALVELTVAVGAVVSRASIALDGLRSQLQETIAERDTVSATAEAREQAIAARDQALRDAGDQVQAITDERDAALLTANSTTAATQTQRDQIKGLTEQLTQLAATLS